VFRQMPCSRLAVRPLSLEPLSAAVGLRHVGLQEFIQPLAPLLKPAMSHEPQ
jgi:hypothetical protein